jgi:serine protease Do
MHDAEIGTAPSLEWQPVRAVKAFPMLAPSLHRLHRTRSAALLLGLVLTTAACTQANGPYVASGGPGAPVPSFAPIVQEVMPAVVNVSAIHRASKAAAEAGRKEDQIALRGIPPSVLDELLRRFLDTRDRSGSSAPKVASVALGSGFIVDPSGYIVTDDHVLEDADRVSVVFPDATDYPARIVGRDPLTDLALLKIDAAGPLSFVRWGDSDTARVGDWVLAIGNPFGLDNTVSSGIISGRGRDLHTGPYDDFLQIDAAMNRGNSGGPTFDLHGNVIGINTAIYSPNGGSVGIGFAIPANRAKPVVEQLQTYGKVERGWLGLQIQEVTPEIARGLGLPKAGGALVARVGAGSPAAAAGFAPGDVVLSANGQDIRRMHDLPLAIAEMPIGRLAAITVWRGNSALSLTPVIGEMPMDPAAALSQQGRPESRRSERETTAPMPVSVSAPAI